MRLGVDADTERRPGRTEDRRFTGSNVCDCGGLFTADVPSYYKHSEVMIMEGIYNATSLTIARAHSFIMNGVKGTESPVAASI
jgi:hypothetical protein